MKYSVKVKFGDTYKYITKLSGTSFVCEINEHPMKFTKSRAKILVSDLKLAGYDASIEGGE